MRAIWLGPLAALRLHLLDGPHLFAGVLGVELVGPVADGVEVVAALHQGVHTVVDRDEPDALLWEVELRQLTHLQVLTPQAAENLDDQGLHLAVLDHLHDFLPRGPLDCRCVVSIILLSRQAWLRYHTSTKLVPEYPSSDRNRVFSNPLSAAYFSRNSF